MSSFYKKTQTEVVRTAFTVKTNEYDQVEVYWSEEIKDITLDHLIELKILIKSIANNDKKVPVIFFINNYNQISKEARSYLLSKIANENILAYALIIKNLFKRLTVNFFVRVTNIPIPTKCFANKQQAITWLNKQTIESEHSTEKYILN